MSAAPLNRALRLPLLLLSLLSLSTGLILLMGKDYFTVGYTTVGRDISASGFQIWDLHGLCLVLMLGLLPLIVGLLLWAQVLKRPLGTGRAMLLSLLCMGISLLFLPGPFDFQVRHYRSPAQGITVMRLEEPKGLFVLSRKGEYVHAIDDSGNGRNFYCIESGTLSIGALRIDWHLYPILDKPNQLRLLEQHCQS